MNPESREGTERFLQHLLDDYHEALAAGGEPERVRRAEACLRRLEKQRLAAPAPPRPALPGFVRPKYLGRFRIVREIGSGAHGVVYLAYDPRARREVALKVPRLEALVVPDLRQRFLREARAAAGLNHPNLVTMFEAGEEDGLCYIASAYCPGPTLAEWLHLLAGPVVPRIAAGLLRQLADGVEHAHSRGVLHRDLKPANILLRAEGNADSPLVPLITDFGLAKLTEADDDSTPTGVILGTPSYMAPEQADPRLASVSPATDVHALGVIFYELLTGQTPSGAIAPADAWRYLLHEEPTPPRRLRADLPCELETICLHCLHREPRRRYPSARALRDDLDRWQRGEPVQT